MKDFLSHFGVQTLPFTRELPAGQHFTLPQFEEAVSGLLDAVMNRMSCAFIAASGTGKSTVTRLLLARLPEARYRTSYLKLTGLSRRDAARDLAVALGLEPAGSFPALVRRLQDFFLNSIETESRRPVLVLDDAHEQRPEVLRLLRVLTNFEMDSRLVVSIVLVGQSRLREILARNDLEDVARRLAHIATLSPLSKTETTSYIKHRIVIAGGKTVPFDAHAQEAVFEIARGNLRATDHLALKAMQLAHGDDAKMVDSNHVAQARGMVCI
jgi:general secretion pathway protein A